MWSRCSQPMPSSSTRRISSPRHSGLHPARRAVSQSFFRSLLVTSFPIFPNLRKQFAVSLPAFRAKHPRVYRGMHGASRFPVVQARLKAAFTSQRIIFRINLGKILRVNPRFKLKQTESRACPAQTCRPQPSSLRGASYADRARSFGSSRRFPTPNQTAH